MEVHCRKNSEAGRYGVFKELEQFSAIVTQCAWRRIKQVIKQVWFTLRRFELHAKYLGVYSIVPFSASPLPLASSSYHFLTWKLKTPIKNDCLDEPLVIKKDINPEAGYFGFLNPVPTCTRSLLHTIKQFSNTSKYSVIQLSSPDFWHYLPWDSIGFHM